MTTLIKKEVVINGDMYEVVINYDNNPFNNIDISTLESFTSKHIDKLPDPKMASKIYIKSEELEYNYNMKFFTVHDIHTVYDTEVLSESDGYIILNVFNVRYQQ